MTVPVMVATILGSPETIKIHKTKHPKSVQCQWKESTVMYKTLAMETSISLISRVFF